MSSVGPSERPSRRSALKTLVVGGLVAVAAGTVARVRGGGYEAAGSAARRSLRPWEATVVAHAARRIAATDRPDDRTIPTPDEVDVVGFVDTYVARMAAPMRRDLSRALLFLEQVAPLSVGLMGRFTDLPGYDQDRVLHALEHAPVALLRGAFAGIKSLVFMGYYRDPRTWRLLGYGGPWLARKDRAGGAARP